MIKMNHLDPQIGSIRSLILALTVCLGWVFSNSVNASTSTQSLKGPFTNRALTDLGPSIVALIENPNHKGPNQETTQLVVFRVGPSSFQVLRKWLASDSTGLNERLNLQWDYKLYDEIVSVVSNHAFSAIVPTQNILDYESSTTNILDEVASLNEVNLHAEKNLLLRNIKLQQSLYSSVFLCGIPTVVRVNAPLGNNRYSVKTYTDEDATLKVEANERNAYRFRLLLQDKEVARSIFRLPLESSDGSKAILQSEKRSQLNGEWKFALAAKFFPIPNKFPTIEEVHFQVFREAFINGHFAHRDRYSNGVIYSFSNIKNPVPISKRPVTKKISRSSQTVLIRTTLGAMFLAGLAIILKSLIRSGNKGVNPN